MNETEIKQAFLELIRRAREDRGMTPSEAAQAAGIDASNWSHYETGNRSCSWKMIVRMGKVVGLEVVFVAREGLSGGMSFESEVMGI